ncbi:MAG: hypothetical protein EHM70_20855, partial [Chloroflexota bacterium]
AQAGEVFAPRLIELCFQTAGIWDIKNNASLALPASIRSVKVYRGEQEAAGKGVFALVRPLDGGAAFDAIVLDQEGQVYVEMTGYRTVRLPGKVVI